MAIVSKNKLLDADMDIPSTDSVTIATTSALIPPPIIAVISVTPTLIPNGSTLGQGSNVTAIPSAPAPVVTVTFSGAWPQENFPNFTYKYIILPSTTEILAKTLDEIPAGATITGYSADTTLMKTNTWTIQYTEGGIPATAPVTQTVHNNFSRQSLKLRARLGL